MLYFQSQEREVDITLVHVLYASETYVQNDFIGPLTTYDIHLMSGAPKPRSNMLTLIKPFDPSVWRLLIASVVAVSISLVLINKIDNKISNKQVQETPLQSINEVGLEIFKRKLCLYCFLGILFSIGAVIEESQGQHDKNNYISERNCSRARSFLVLKWTVLAFC